ncbi:hypothetical protein AVEN_87930-1 [Araneus ventricosus]|uniref:Uncharacterized protein n=1 Tax=Araneus ventricosus TaxID=182803 RepID=A0A4Y2UQP1_ARAVE|nr:hypothetical protein AVEN_87930-1 [Araneus ventricosus]
MTYKSLVQNWCMVQLFDCHLIFSLLTRFPQHAIKHMDLCYMKKNEIFATSANIKSWKKICIQSNYIAELFTCVLRVDSVQPPHSKPYTGPHEVVNLQ